MCDVNVGWFAILQTVKKESISTNPEQYRHCRSLHPDRDTSCPRLPLLLFHPTNKLLTASDDFFVQMQIWMLLVLRVYPQRRRNRRRRVHRLVELNPLRG